LVGRDAYRRCTEKTPVDPALLLAANTGITTSQPAITPANPAKHTVAAHGRPVTLRDPVSRRTRPPTTYTILLVERQ